MKIKKFIPNTQFRYYYSILDVSEKNIYDSLLAGLLQFKDNIKIWCFDKNRLFLIFSYLKLDIPELFFVQTINIEYTVMSLSAVNVKPIYRFSCFTTCEMLQDMENEFEEMILSGLSLTEIEREYMIHDYIVSSVKYMDSDKPYSHEAPGVLLYGIGVCEGVSKSAKWLCDRLQLKSAVAIGESYANGNLGGHSWNIIWVNNNPYHVDMTFDNTITSSSIRYDYLNLNDIEILGDRQVNVDYPLPKCQKSLNWYIENHLYFESRKALVRFLRTKNNEKSFSFQLPLFSEKNEEVITNIITIINNNLSSYKSGTCYKLKYNVDRMVFEVVFSDK